MPVLKNIKENINQFIKRFGEISSDRKEVLTTFADYISFKLQEGEDVNLTFICTHNSRRSHMSQIWTQAAAEYYGIKNVFCYSGGTEATAFNPRAVRTLVKIGFEISQKDESENPVYLVRYSENKLPLERFSKVYNDPFNPQKDYAAIMTCSDADKNCPVVFGAEERFPIRYNDPKEFDDTKIEEKMYDERCAQIAVEMLFAFSQVKII